MNTTKYILLSCIPIQLVLIINNLNLFIDSKNYLAYLKIIVKSSFSGNHENNHPVTELVTR